MQHCCPPMAAFKLPADSRPLNGGRQLKGWIESCTLSVPGGGWAAGAGDPEMTLVGRNESHLSLRAPGPSCKKTCLLMYHLWLRPSDLVRAVMGFHRGINLSECLFQTAFPSWAERPCSSFWSVPEADA